MNASIRGSKDWWLVVQSMPAIEALQHVQDYREELLSATDGAPKPTEAAVLSRLNVEIKRLNKCINEACWQKACRMVLDEDTFSNVYEVMRGIEREERA